jgi:hypothetical protein
VARYRAGVRRTPLFVIKGSAQLYRMGALADRADVDEAMHRIDRDARAHDGDVVLETALGEGACFRLIMPLLRDSPRMTTRSD